MVEIYRQHVQTNYIYDVLRSSCSGENLRAIWISNKILDLGFYVYLVEIELKIPITYHKSMKFFLTWYFWLEKYIALKEIDAKKIFHARQEFFKR